MRVVSVNVGLPRQVPWRGEMVSTAIFKEPATERVPVRGVNFEGDGQADLTVHGGSDKAVYVYPAEHYVPWRAELARSLPWGMFGENLTVEGLLLEDELALGDRLRIGSAEFIVTQPRLPCHKLGLRFNDAGMVRRFLAAGRSGYYLRIVEEGEVAAGDFIEILERHPAHVPVSEITRLFTRDRHDVEGIRRILRVDAIPLDWRECFEEVLRKAGGPGLRPHPNRSSAPRPR